MRLTPPPAAARTRRPPTPTRASAEDDAPPPPDPLAPARRRRSVPSSSDAIASSLTRRFGLAGGLAWLGVLTAGVLGEQIKTRLEVAQAQADTKRVDGAAPVLLPDGTAYVDEVVGGGTAIARGLLVALHSTLATADGVVIDDTRARGKPIVFLFGSRPLTGGLTLGAEAALAGMRAGGHVPEKRGEVPPGADLEYRLQVVSVSVPPS